MAKLETATDIDWTVFCEPHWRIEHARFQLNQGIFLSEPAGWNRTNLTRYSS